MDEHGFISSACAVNHCRNAVRRMLFWWRIWLFPCVISPQRRISWIQYGIHRGSSATNAISISSEIRPPLSAMPASSGMSGNCSSFTTSWPETLLFPQVVYRLRHHYPCHPGTNAFATEGEMGKDFDEPIVQYVMRSIFVARIAVAYRKHLLGIKGIQFLTCGILSCPAALYQFYFIFQCQCFFYGRLFVC